MTISSSQLLYNMDNYSPTEGMGTELNKTKNMIKVVYDFAVLGGAVGAISLVDDQGDAAVLPAGAIIHQVIIDVVTAPTSGGSATIAFDSEGAGDLKAATAIASYTGVMAGVPVGTAASCVKLTAQRTIKATVATAALTDGKINLFVEYFLSS